ncbi:hypothetical protein [Aureibaculum luteum]|uniref:hypothetical protein n=1 Tax=Aureibaculum luteum TaxID=1548456 RepID=UPI000E53FA13|nr:hypothetical protein [Aureibaculum luteum]
MVKSKKYLLKLSVISFFILFSIGARAQNFSGLQGKELTKIDDTAFALLQIGAKKLDGQIDKVAVLYSGEKTLKLEIHHSGIESTWVSYKIIDAEKKSLNGIKNVKYTLIEGEKPLQVEITLEDNLPEGTEIQSSYLQIDVKKEKKNFLPTTFLYSLEKLWKTEINAENLIIPIKLEPIGSAKDLRADNHVFVIPYKRPTFNSSYMTTSTGTATNENGSNRETAPVIREGVTRRNEIVPAVRGRATRKNEVVPAVRGKATRRNETVQAVRGKDPAKTLEVLGPDNLNQISLWDNLATDVNFEFPFDITNIQMNIYSDKNLNSGVFYYLPEAYHLQWNTNTGYQFDMLYGTASSSEISGNVNMSGVLTPNISKKESDLIKALLNSYINNNKSIYTNDNIDLKIIPIKSTPTISLSEGLQSAYEIPDKDINVTMSSTINNPINVSWKVDNRIKEEIQVALSENGGGIFGNMSLTPDSETIPEQKIPVRITLADTRTIGKFILQPNNWRTENWVNETPFPLKLKYIHALVIGEENGRNLPMVYSWGLNNTEVPSKSKAKFNGALMPKWIESKTERIWIDYSIDECNSCMNEIMNELTGGTSGSNTKTVNFKSFKVLETTKAAFLEIQIRSKQADPKAKNIIKLTSIIIEKDLSAISAGPFYLPEGSELKYEYKLKLVMSDGKIHESDDWISSDEVDVYIGMHTLKETISNLPEFQ